jgi:flagellar motor switch protein FliN/FliY
MEPLAADAGGVAHWDMPPLLANGEPLYRVDLTLDVDGIPVCPLQIVFAESGERALLGLEEMPQESAGPTAHTNAAPAYSNNPAPMDAPPARQAAQSSSPSQMPQARQAQPIQQVQTAQFSPLGPEQVVSRGHGIDLIRDVPLKISVELGRASLTVREVLALGAGSVVELDRLAGEPVDVLVNDRLIARGEVVIVDESFGVRITDLIRQPR